MTSAKTTAAESGPGPSAWSNLRWRARRLGPTVVIAFAFAAPSVARAAGPEDKAAADELYDAGEALMARGDVAAACRKLEESQHLYPRSGVLLTVAVCHEKEGRLASAYAEFGEALAQARREQHAVREATAKEHLAALALRVPKLVVRVSADAPGLEVKRDGTSLGPGSFGAELPVDAGAHTVVAAAPGRKTWEMTVDVAIGKTTAVVVPTLEALTSSDGAAAPPTRGPWRRPAGLASLGVAAVLIGIGTGFGVDAITKHDASSPNCPSGTCNPTGWSVYQSGKGSALASDFLVGGGVACAGLGAYLLISAPPRASLAQAAPRGAAAVRLGWVVQPAAAGGSLEGQW